MIKSFKTLFLIVGFPLLTLLTGCKSEEAFNSDSQLPADAVVVEITVTPSPISVLEGRTQQLIAMAKVDNESEKDVSNSVTWEIVGDPTVASISDSGLLTGNTEGDTELTASKDGITSNTVNVHVCGDLAGPCVDIFDTSSGKLFTNSPSVAYLDSIGGSAIYGTVTEPVNMGPVGDFYLFDWNDANALCTTYNTHSLGGRTNWRLATRDELTIELYDAFSDMFIARGWPTSHYYWSATPDGSNYYYVNVRTGNVYFVSPGSPHFVSCVSNPSS